MSHLDARNKRALASGQAAWDNALPPEDDGEREYVDGQVEILLSGSSSDSVCFDEFRDAAGEAVAGADNGAIILMMLAIRAKDLRLAGYIYSTAFEKVTCEAAEACVRKAMERK